MIIAPTSSLAELPPARPPLKWVGGKRQLLTELRKHVPDRFGHYYEPFVGGGALFFDLAATAARHTVVVGRPQPRWATLSDSNEELISTYYGIRDHLPDTLRKLRLYTSAYARRGAAFYYDLRDRDPCVEEPHLCAARMIALNKTCFNGLYRVNRSGKFNTPAGKFKSPPTICDETNLRAVSAVLKGTQLTTAAFHASPAQAARKGDLVYMDPPYWPVNETSFVGYHGAGFDQEQLRDFALALKKKGVHVLLSNADVPAVRALYRRFEVRRVEALRAVNSKADKRGAVGELLIW